MRILMVCLGNICRSPIAEGVLQHMANEQGLEWTVDSAGTNSYHTGQAPHRFSQAVCKTHGIDISGQKARLFRASDLDDYDLVYAMAIDVRNEMAEMVGRNADMSKVKLFLNEIEPGKNSSVPDPWFGEEDGYLPVFQIIQQTCKAIVEKYGQKV